MWWHYLLYPANLIVATILAGYLLFWGGRNPAKRWPVGLLAIVILATAFLSGLLYR